MTSSRLLGLMILAWLFIAGSALAAEETLKFRLITTVVDVTSLPAPYTEDRSAAAMSAAGVAVFEDGRVAFKEYVFSMDNRGAEGNYTGYSTYTFENGDQLNLSFSGGWGADGSGGDYVIQSGTGAFEGATGTGRFDAAKEPWENGALWDGSFTITSGGD